MQVLIGEIRPFPNARADAEQAAKILEEAAEVFAAWQEYDRRERASVAPEEDAKMWRDWARENLLNECADLIMACSNMRARCSVRDLDKFFNTQAHLAKVYLAAPTPLEKPNVRSILNSASLIDSATNFYARICRECGVNSEQSYSACEWLLSKTRECIIRTCGIIAALGVEDFTPYMKECEQRNRERGRYEHQAN